MIEARSCWEWLMLEWGRLSQWCVIWIYQFSIAGRDSLIVNSEWGLFIETDSQQQIAVSAMRCWEKPDSYWDWFSIRKRNDRGRGYWISITVLMRLNLNKADSIALPSPVSITPPYWEWHQFFIFYQSIRYVGTLVACNVSVDAWHGLCLHPYKIV